MKNDVIFLSTILLIIIGCNSKPDKKVEDDIRTASVQIDNTIDTDGKVVIMGRSDDIQALDYLDVIDGTYYFKKNEGDSIRKYNDSVVLILNNIKQKQFSEFTAVSENHYYKTKLFLKPGDSLFFKISNGELKFFGSNAAANNFYIQLDKKTTSFWDNSYDSNMMDYKEKVEAIYKEKTEFFNDYVQHNNITSKGFIKFIKDDLRQEYLSELMNPRSKYTDINQNMYYSEIDGLQTVISEEYDRYDRKEKIFSFEEYFSDVSFEDINRPDLIYNRHFAENLNLYIRNYFETSDNINYSKGKFLAERKFIKDKLDPKLLNFAMGEMINDYHLKGFGYDKDNADFMIEMIDQYKDSIEGYPRERLMAIRDDLVSSNFKLSSFAFESKMVNHLGDTTTLNEIFNRSKERTKVVDFWASWCPPCIIQIKDNKDLKDRLTVESNVEWIYLSIDEDQSQWEKGSNALEEYLNFRNNYFLIDGKKSSLAKFLKVSTIPRYVIFDKENYIILNNAPIPGKNPSFERIIDSIK